MFVTLPLTFAIRGITYHFLEATFVDYIFGEYTMGQAALY